MSARSDSQEIEPRDPQVDVLSEEDRNEADAIDVAARRGEAV